MKYEEGDVVYLKKGKYQSAFCWHRQHPNIEYLGVIKTTMSGLYMVNILSHSSRLESWMHSSAWTYYEGEIKCKVDYIDIPLKIRKKLILEAL